MRAFEAIRKAPVTASRDTTLSEVAEIMNAHAIGAVVVVDGEQPVGIVTDRDLVVRGVARNMPLDARIDSIMSHDLVVMHPDDDLRAALPVFRTHAIRRIPLVADDRVVGMLTVDDLLVDLIADLSDVVRPVTGEVLFGYAERATTPVH